MILQILKSINEYMDNKEARIDDIISTTLNNFAVASSEYGVIKYMMLR